MARKILHSRGNKIPHAKLWAAILLISLVGLAGNMIAFADNGALSIQISANAFPPSAEGFSHELEISWKATGGTPPLHVTLKAIGPDGSEQAYPDESLEGNRRIDLTYPNGGMVSVEIHVVDASGSTASATADVQLMPTDWMETETPTSPCLEMVFSTEEDFVTHGPVPMDGNPIISDGDLLGRGCVVCARNADLLRIFQVTADLGLDAVDVIGGEANLIAFSTELNSPNLGQFTAGDLLATNGAIIPNAALLALFGVRGGDLGLDAIHLLGKTESIIAFLDEVYEMGRAYWLREGTLQAALRQYSVNIWFSTEGTAPYPTFPAFLDGDLLSARDGMIVVGQAQLLTASIPAGIPNRGVDFGLDAVTCDRMGDMKSIYFSTEILYSHGTSFTDGDILLNSAGIAFTNGYLIGCFEPKASFLGLDALFINEP
ncbi:hypothetical protein ACFLSW_05470 [Candidatus Bipolaricaulota bacterium]